MRVVIKIRVCMTKDFEFSVKKPFINVFISATFGKENIVLLFTLGIYADHDGRCR